MNNIKVTAVAVVYGQRWSLLKQVLDATLKDLRVSEFIIVDNACFDHKEMDEYAINNRRVTILRQNKNIGYSGAISKGLEKARETDCDYVFVLDDDSVPEENYLDFFLNNLKLFKDKKVVLSANRVTISAYEEYFHTQPKINALNNGTNFEVFSFKKVFNLLNAFNVLENKKGKADFIPILPSPAFVTGGSFLPIKAVREAPLPDPKLFMYGEDIEYSWGVKALGYKSYVCYRSILTDLDLTFGNNKNSHLTGLFDFNTPDYKVYLRIRNSVIISKRNTKQNKIVFLINVITWTFGLMIIGLFFTRPITRYTERVKLIYLATTNGYKNITKIPLTIKTP